MAAVVKALTEQPRADVTARFATIVAPHTVTALSLNATQLARGSQLAHHGDETRRVQSCNACHGPDGVGASHAAPYVAGQSATYLATALKAFHQGTRTNDAGELMRSVADGLSAEDVAAVSGYFASIHFSGD